MADSKIDDGGLAFPGSRYEQVGTLADHGGDDFSPTYADVKHPGMSLRDWFAGQAMNAINCTWSDKETRTLFAKRCYAMADAMIAARKGGAA